MFIAQVLNESLAVPNAMANPVAFEGTTLVQGFLGRNFKTPTGFMYIDKNAGRSEEIVLANQIAANGTFAVGAFLHSRDGELLSFD